MGRGPARPINFSWDGPWPGPAHQISEDGPRLGPAHYIFDFSRPGPSQFLDRPGPARPGPDKRPMTSPAIVAIHALNNFFVVLTVRRPSSDTVVV